jgi:hypothetical protein
MYYKADLAQFELRYYEPISLMPTNGMFYYSACGERKQVATCLHGVAGMVENSSIA